VKEKIQQLSEIFKQNKYLVDSKLYSGNSKRVNGYGMVEEVTGGIPNVVTINPLIVSSEVCDSFGRYGFASMRLWRCGFDAWRKLNKNKEPIIVRRVFPNKEGETMTGPRSGNIRSLFELVTVMTEFYKFHKENYADTDVKPEIMIHNTVDVGRPPLKKRPFLPHPGGDVTPLGNHSYQIRATFGADESAQGYPCDEWIVKFKSGGGCEVYPPIKATKIESKIPSKGHYRKFLIPDEYKDVLSLDEIKVLSLAMVAKKMEDKHGGYRLEFDETVINGKDQIVIIEASPFREYNNSHENLKKFGDKIVRPLNIVKTIDDIEKLQENSLAIVHLTHEMFQANETRRTLINIALTAKAKNISLAVLVAGNKATQHVIRDFIDHGASIWFTHNEKFEQGEKIRLSKKIDGTYGWERENPIVEQGKIKGRSVEKVGGKARGLWKLEKYGFPVPPYIAIETSLYRRIIKDLDVGKEILALDSLSPTDRVDYTANLTKDIQNKIIQYNGNLIPDLKYQYSKIGEGKSVYVRSSATKEDGNESFAGIFKTESNVSMEKLNSAILSVLASGLDPSVIKAALVNDIKPSDIEVAVVVQKMIDAKISGTIFTKDHILNDENMIRIEVTRGLGDQIVDGTAKESQHALVNKTIGEVEFIKDGSKTYDILSKEEIVRLAKVGILVEDALKEGPQDIEWGVEKGTDMFYLLQTRQLV